MEDEGIGVEGVEIMLGCVSERKSLMSRDRLNSEKGRDGCRCLDEVDLPDRLDLGAVLESRDSKRVMSLDTAIFASRFNEEGRMVDGPASPGKVSGGNLILHGVDVRQICRESKFAN
jgi:hypothetical protein